VRQENPPPIGVTQGQYGFSPGHARVGSWDLARRDAHLAFKYWVVAESLEAHGLSGRLVDVGCGSGLLQQYLATRGWLQTVGVEPSGESNGREALGLEVFNESVADFLKRPGSEGGFDVAVANHVIEHCYDPAAFVAELRRLLRSGGHALVATPNIGGLSMRWKSFASRFGLKSRPYRHLDYPKHLMLFDRRGLGRLLGSAGFEVLEVATCTRLSRNSSKRPRQFGSWDRLGLGDNMLAVARKPLA